MSSGLIPPSVDPVFYDSMLERWRDNPNAVDAGWRALFQELEETPVGAASTGAEPLSNGHGDLVAAVLRRAFRERGHLIADCDPLNRKGNSAARDPGVKQFGLDPLAILASKTWSALASDLNKAYCGTLSAEFMHLDETEPRDWLASAMETGFGAPDAAQKTHILDLLIAAETFENFMQTKLPTIKRYGMEGSETQMPLSERLLECAAVNGVEEIVLGPMHRGRTTFMALFMEKPLPAVFSEFQGEPWYPADLDIAGDVAYHMGASVDRVIGEHTVHISMASHPSHIETVIPVSLGKARARQREAPPETILGLMMHTDAGFAGQGVVAESFQLSRLEGYSTGGSIHVVANNQVGFTTKPEDGRSSRYCTDMGKIVQAPVLRVNADDPEAGFRAASIASEFWKLFHRDIIIDLVCYRRQGHNELDEPRFTQPKMYQRIDRLPSVTRLYSDRLLAEDVVPEDWAEHCRSRHWARYDNAFKSAPAYKPNKASRFDRHWSGFRHQDLEALQEQPETGVPVDILKSLAAGQVNWPAGFNLNGRLKKQLEARAQTVAKGGDINWAAAEALAFASLLTEGVPIRMTGEDTVRGTFSHRHCVVLDEATETPHVPLNHLAQGQAHMEVRDSPLSEEAVLAFEYGYSLADPKVLVIWEAQFGDFVNVAQVFIDQYIAPGEEKWLRSSGLVLLLPHGLEGGGPEHSSARVERFLQLCAKGNMHVVNCTTPANQFHAMRRQMCRDYRKPLISLTPKLLLRHKHAVSGLDELGEGARFQPVLADRNKPRQAQRVILCSGRVFYDLDAMRGERGIDTVALVRIEELYPFPADALAAALKPHPKAEVVWCQEEPENMGPWSFVDRRIQSVLDGLGRKKTKLRCVARPANPSPAPGFKSVYEREQVDVLERAIAGKAAD